MPNKAIGLFVLLTDLQSDEDITLTSTLGRRQAACPGEVVVYTCIALRTTAVDWTARPDVQSVTFFQDDTDTERTVGGFQLALTGRVPNGTGFSDLTSTLTVTSTVSQNATVIECVGSSGNRELELRVVTSPPPPPLNPVHHIQQYGRHNFTTFVQWSHPVYDGVIPDNYTISGTHFVTTFSETNETTLTLPYNELQTISITGNNCNGSSSATTFAIYEVNCGEPATPGNGFIQPYHNTTEGAEISFRCNSGFVPSTTMMAMCGADGRWNPDPATHMCTFDCGPPPAPRNGSLESYSDTTECSVVFYSCDPGLVPERRMMSVCTGTGWSPNPGAISCSVVDCGSPKIPWNGSLESYNDTMEDSVVFYSCDPGLVPEGRMRAMCTENGWSPNPGDLNCFEETSCGSCSCSTSVAVTAVVSCAVSFIIGALVAALVNYCAVRKKCHKFYSLTIARKQQKQQPAPVYEDIVAQKGTVDPTHIELRENIAYGPVNN